MFSYRRGGWLPAVLVLVLSPFAYSQASRSTAAKPRQPETPAVKVSHLEDEDGWHIAQTSNFRLFHRHPRALAEELLRAAERTRAAQLRKWFGAVGPDWDPKCDIHWYASNVAYSEATGAPASAHGHTDLTLDGDHVLARHIHIHGTRDTLLPAVLPHEVTHAVLAGRFGGPKVPRWADEGMAILAETRPRIDRHLRELPRFREDHVLFTVRQLIGQSDYPPSRAVGVFYAQSVSLVDFLTRQKGAKCFCAFVRDGERDGYAASLRQHYGWTFAELERRWQRHAFRDEEGAEITAGGGR